MAQAFAHENPNKGNSNDWITPKWIIDAFNSLEDWREGDYFDLDPCASLFQPWATARNHYTINDDGLAQEWRGNVWLNPPYGAEATPFIEKMSNHDGGGIALIFARIETKLWQDIIIPSASGYLFPNKRLSFYEFECVCGKPRSWHYSSSVKKRRESCGVFKNSGKAIEGDSAGTASALIAWGDDNRSALIELVETGKIEGAFAEMMFYTGSRHWSLPIEKQNPLPFTEQ